MLILLDLRSPRRYSPYVRHSPYRTLSRDFSLGLSSSGDLEISQPAISTCTSCGRPSPVDNVFLNCSIRASVTSERELEARPVVHDLREPEEDDREKEISFPGAYPIEQVVNALDEPATLPARHFVKVAQKKYSESGVHPCPTVYPSAQYGFKELFFRFFTYFFEW